METLKKLRGTVLLPMIAMVLLNANAAPLVINTDTSDQAVKAAFDAAVSDFKIENPDVQVKVNRFDHDAYKTAIRNFLTADSPDVVNWYPGHKMEPFVRAGLFEDVSDIWTKYNLDTKLKSASSAMTLNGKNGESLTRITSGESTIEKIFFRNLASSRLTLGRNCSTHAQSSRRTVLRRSSSGPRNRGRILRGSTILIYV